MENKSNIDSILLKQFEQEIWNKIPHLAEESDGAKVVHATPLIDITKDLAECAKKVFGLDLANRDLQVFGKFDSNLIAGSIKVRPAVHIVHDAIISGKLKRGQTLFEATSGNFGIALGQIAKIGLDVVTLVSRRLQEGVFEELRNEKIRIINLDMDICPAPGMKDNSNLLAAKATALNIRSQLSELGFDPVIFDSSITKAEALLAKQDIINLAKLLADIYGCFCPEQYDNELNIDVHRTVTAAEIDQQLHEKNHSLAEYHVVCTFGTGGTSGGLSRYMMEKFNKKSLHVVFPLDNQDVAGIRTKSKAAGLKFYEPERYAEQHEVDFEQAKRLLKFFVDKNYDMGESSALALYAVLQMINLGGYGEKFIVIIADGIQKYRKNLQEMEKKQNRLQVNLPEALSDIGTYDRVIWIHTQYTPQQEGIDLIANSLGVAQDKIFIPKARDVERLLATHEIPKELDLALGGSDGKSLLVCMMGNTSLIVARELAGKGIVTESLNGGINALSKGRGIPISNLVRIATE